MDEYTCVLAVYVDHASMVYFLLPFPHTANPNTCTVHITNDGVTVNGDTATVEFAGSGPTASFVCSLDGQGFSPCELNCARNMWCEDF